MDFFGVHISQPDVALTDYALTVECLILSLWLVVKRAGGNILLRNWFVLFYAAIGTASFFGGTYHGFFEEPPHPIGPALWRITLLAIGVTAFTCWNLGKKLMGWSEPVQRAVLILSALYFAGYAAYVCSTIPSFLVAVAGYLPSILFLLFACVRLWFLSKNRPSAFAVVGLLLTLLAAAVQQGKITLHPDYFNHNALYHVIQAIALLFFARLATWLVHEGGAQEQAVDDREHSTGSVS